MLRFATAGFTASKSIINFQHGRSLALFVWPQQSRRYMSNDDARQKGLTETTKSVLAQGVVTAGLRAEIICSSDPVIKKLFSSLLKSVEIFKEEEAAAKLGGSELKGNQVSGLKPGITIIASNPHGSGQGSYSLTELRNRNLLDLWDMMKVAGKSNSDCPELQQVYGRKSTVLLRDLFLSFQVTVMELTIPKLLELDQLEWHEKIRNWSEDGPNGLDLTHFRCMQLFDLGVKRLNLNSFLRKTFGFDDMGDYIKICKFAQAWEKVSSLETRRLGMYYVADDEGEVNSGFKLLGLFGKGGSYKASSTKSIDSDVMQSNALKIAVCLSQLS